MWDGGGGGQGLTGGGTGVTAPGWTGVRRLLSARSWPGGSVGLLFPEDGGEIFESASFLDPSFSHCLCFSS